MAAVKNPVDLERPLKAELCPGPPFTWTKEECAMIKIRLITAAKSGFAVDQYTFKHVLYRIASDGRKGFKSGLRNDVFLRIYRALNRGICFKRIENLDNAKPEAQSVDHVETFFGIGTHSKCTS